MSYHINKKTKKDGTVYWRLLRSEWSANKVKYSHIPNEQLSQHGLSPLMPIEEAKARVKQLNALSRSDRQAARTKANALKQQAERKLQKSAHLPEPFLTEYEQNYLKTEMAIGPLGPTKYKKALSNWETAKRLIIAVNLPQQFWYQHKRRFYAEMSAECMAPSYTGKVLRVLNLWGAFIAMKTGTSYIPVPPPSGYDREMIADAYIESDKRSRTSAALSPEHLSAAKSRLKEEQWRWLYLSVWLGLRPSEVDGLNTSKITREQGVAVLWVYQSKLKGVKKEDRFKPIPLIYPEQKKCTELLKQNVKRPLVKTVQKHVLAEANLYGGRKGFTDLMLSKGQALEDISVWLGHATIERTWASYKRRQRVSFRKTG